MSSLHFGTGARCGMYRYTPNGSGYNLHARPFKTFFLSHFVIHPSRRLHPETRESIKRQAMASFYLLFHHDGKTQPSLVRLRGACPAPFNYIYHHELSCGVRYPPAEKADTLLIFPFYLFILCEFTNSIYLSDELYCIILPFSGGF
jgi:hypothetical protein